MEATTALKKKKTIAHLQAKKNIWPTLMTEMNS